MIYLDNAASAVPNQIVIDRAAEIAEKVYGNPAAVHLEGVEAGKLVFQARQDILKYLGADEDDELIFTSGATESNSIGIQGLLRANPSRYKLIVSKIEHNDIMMLCDWVKENSMLYTPPSYIPVSKEGFVDYDVLKAQLQIAQQSNQIPLVVIQGSNSEVGTMQNLRSLALLIHYYNGILFSDVTQLLPNRVMKLKYWGVDVATASSQKIGLKGSGFLYIRKGLKINSVIFGEQGIRGGTPNVIAIDSFRCAMQHLYDQGEFNTFEDRIARMDILRDRVIARLKDECDAELIGDDTMRNCNNISVILRGTDMNAQQLVALFDLRGFAISAGSACSNYVAKPSHVLKAMGYSDEDANRVIRITLGWNNTVNEAMAFCDEAKLICERLSHANENADKMNK